MYGNAVNAADTRPAAMSSTAERPEHPRGRDRREVGRDDDAGAVGERRHDLREGAGEVVEGTRVGGVPGRAQRREHVGLEELPEPVEVGHRIGGLDHVARAPDTRQDRDEDQQHPQADSRQREPGGPLEVARRVRRRHLSARSDGEPDEVGEQYRQRGRGGQEPRGPRQVQERRQHRGPSEQRRPEGRGDAPRGDATEPDRIRDGRPGDEHDRHTEHERWQHRQPLAHGWHPTGSILADFLPNWLRHTMEARPSSAMAEFARLAR
jgi:hypothetical protein